MRGLMRAPLLHFLVLGFLLFVLFDRVSGGRGGADRRIVVGEATVAELAQTFERTWRRKATPGEMRNLVDAYVRDEILFREGKAMGLDRDDTVVRQRVLLKLQVLAEESAARSVVPTDADLQAYLRKHPDRYGRPADIAFDQVMFDPARRGPHLQSDVAAALARLRAGEDPGKMGDSAMLPTINASIPADLLARDYGDRFATILTTLPVGSWNGPIASDYGVHLVRVSGRTQARSAAFEEIRTDIARDWENERRAQAIEAYLQNARPKYDVVIEAELPAASRQGMRDR